MINEFIIETANEPGMLAEIGHTLGRARVNIDALQGYSHGDVSFIHLVCDEHDEAKKALDEAGIRYTINEVLVVQIMDQRGTLGDVAMVMKNAGINIEYIYITMRGLVIVGVDDVDGAYEVAGGMAVMKMRP